MARAVKIKTINRVIKVKDDKSLILITLTEDGKESKLLFTGAQLFDCLKDLVPPTRWVEATK